MSTAVVVLVAVGALALVAFLVMTAASPARRTERRLRAERHHAASRYRQVAGHHEARAAELASRPHPADERGTTVPEGTEPRPDGRFARPVEREQFEEELAAGRPHDRTRTEPPPIA